MFVKAMERIDLIDYEIKNGKYVSLDVVKGKDVENLVLNPARYGGSKGENRKLNSGRAGRNKKLKLCEQQGGLPTDEGGGVEQDDDVEANALNDHSSMAVNVYDAGGIGAIGAGAGAAQSAPATFESVSATAAAKTKRKAATSLAATKQKLAKTS